MAQALDVSVSTLFGPSAGPQSEEGYVVRRGARRPLGARAAGLSEALLSPDLTDDFEMVHSTFEPGSKITEWVCRPTQEVGYLISGKLDLEVGSRRFTIHPGDSFRIRGERFRWANSYEEPAIAIWVIAPPVY